MYPRRQPSSEPVFEPAFEPKSTCAAFEPSSPNQAIVTKPSSWKCVDCLIVTVSPLFSRPGKPSRGWRSTQHAADTTRDAWGVGHLLNVNARLEGALGPSSLSSASGHSRQSSTGEPVLRVDIGSSSFAWGPSVLTTRPSTLLPR
ncbi:uncharacterized protein PG986_002345 [Apiospora aurea]|uniref:Uncharacterized protein n=1 Tax=Apiospora aurea TaxID=335848 RepID=A0ABR1QZH4_9PEZI